MSNPSGRLYRLRVAKGNPKLGRPRALRLTPPRAKGRPARKARGAMNKLERAYADELELLKRAGKILDYAFESHKLLLARVEAPGDRQKKACDAWYTPDFLVLTVDAFIEFHEIKGHWEEAARLRIKVAAERHAAFTFVAVTRLARGAGGGWKFERFGPAETAL